MCEILFQNEFESCSKNLVPTQRLLMEQSLKRYELRKSEMIGLSFGVDFGTNWLGRPVYALFHVPEGSKFTKGTEQGVEAKGKSLFYIYILYYYYSYLVVCSNVPVILEGGKLGVLVK